MIPSNTSVPKTIYKYRPYEGLKRHSNFGTQVLSEFKLYASSARHFNDPFDNALPFRYSEESFTLDLFTKKYMRDHPLRNKLPHNELLFQATERYNFIKSYPERNWRKNKDTINEMDNNFYGILSLTVKNDDLLMWSHYANFHKGYCLGFDTVAFISFIGKEYEQYGCKIGPVDYRADYPTLEFILDPDIHSSINRCFSKNTCWAYEEEYRIVLNNKPDHIICYPRELVSEIYLGCNILPQHRDEIRNFLSCSELKPKLYQMDMSYNRFGLDVSEIFY